MWYFLCIRLSNKYPDRTYLRRTYSEDFLHRISLGSRFITFDKVEIMARNRNPVNKNPIDNIVFLDASTKRDIYHCCV